MRAYCRGLTDYGLWRMAGPVSLAKAKAFLEQPYISAIGHQATAEYLSRLLGTSIPFDRQDIQMHPGDVALILRLTKRPPEGQVLTSNEIMRLSSGLAILLRLE
ncbi:STIV orfB116 family protein [Acidithiobacillus sulfuriphilus]|uniref:STIV orfB116 family protein n=1 Tax=Acidithiobacillus sulfuriphilus TaxID=1867749 RepID=UPI003F5DB389